MAVKKNRVVYFEDWMDPKGEKKLREHPDFELMHLKATDPEAKNWAAFEGAHGYIVGSLSKLVSPWYPDDTLLAGCPNMLAICSKGTGYEAINVEACTRAGVLVCNQRGGNRQAVAEHTIGLMIALTKNIAAGDRMLRRPNRVDRVQYKGHDVQGKTIGIVGLGYIGARVAELCRLAFDMEVLAYSPHLTADEIIARGAIPVDLPELLQRSDFVSLHGMGVKETRGMIGREQFALMKPSAFFINTARASIHDEVALAEALAEGRIAGAGLDVFSVEPPPSDHPLLQFDNVIATPHLGGVTFEAREILSVYAADQFVSICAGEVPIRLVNREVWPLYSKRFERIMGFRPAALKV